MNFYFFLITLYYLYHRQRLIIINPKDRVYRFKFLILTDAIYFFSELLFLIWTGSMFFSNIYSGLFLLSLLLVRWFFLPPHNQNRDIFYCVLRMSILCLI
jgi:hypothetical protein